VEYLQNRIVTASFTIYICDIASGGNHNHVNLLYPSIVVTSSPAYALPLSVFYIPVATLSQAAVTIVAVCFKLASSHQTCLFPCGFASGYLSRASPKFQKHHRLFLSAHDIISATISLSHLTSACGTTPAASTSIFSLVLQAGDRGVRLVFQCNILYFRFHSHASIYCSVLAPDRRRLAQSNKCGALPRHVDKCPPRS